MRRFLLSSKNFEESVIHSRCSIAPQARKRSFVCHFAALVFMDYPRVPVASPPAVIQCRAPKVHSLRSERKPVDGEW